MPDLHHKATPTEVANPAETARNARYGLVLFAFYSSLYVAFMLLNAFWPDLMETVVFAGINLAVFYGLALIDVAFLLALLYAWLCRARPESEARP